MTHRLILGISVIALSLSSVFATGCGGEVSGTGGSTGGTGGGTGGTGGNTGGSGGSTGGALPTGDCTSEADCNGNPCVESTPGGFKVCTSFPEEAVGCTPNNPVPDECCTSADCAAGKCYLSTDIPYCGGPAMATYNRCVADECASDADCAGGSVARICAPAGAWGNPHRVCTSAYCKTNADCTAKAGGYCAPVSDPCCFVASGLACIYPGGCRSNEDCASDGSQHCEIDGGAGAGVCKDGPAACPA